MTLEKNDKDHIKSFLTLTLPCFQDCTHDLTKAEAQARWINKLLFDVRPQIHSRTPTGVLLLPLPRVPAAPSSSYVWAAFLGHLSFSMYHCFISIKSVFTGLVLLLNKHFLSFSFGLNWGFLENEWRKMNDRTERAIAPTTTVSRLWLNAGVFTASIIPLALWSSTELRIYNDTSASLMWVLLCKSKIHPTAIIMHAATDCT